MKENFQRNSLKAFLIMKACAWLCHVTIQESLLSSGFTQSLLIIILAHQILIIISRTLEINLGTG